MSVQTFTLNGQLVTATADQTILQAAREQGVEIPTLCHLDGLSDVGACRLCLVEVTGSNKLLPACTTAVPRAWTSAPTPSGCASTGG